MSMFRNDDSLDALIYAMQVSNKIIRNARNQMRRRENIESGCTSKLTDADMIKIHIDIALQNNDRDEFMKLSKQLKELEVSSCTGQ